MDVDDAEVIIYQNICSIPQVFVTDLGSVYIWILLLKNQNVDFIV